MSPERQISFNLRLVQWYYVMNDQAVGPVTMEDLQSLRSNGVLDDQSLVWTESQGDWQALASVLPPPQMQRVETPRSSMTARTGPLIYKPGDAPPEEEPQPQLRPKNYSSTAGALPASASTFAHGAITAPLNRSDMFSPSNAPSYLGGGGGGGGGGLSFGAVTARLEPELARKPEPKIVQQPQPVVVTPRVESLVGLTQQPSLLVNDPGLEFGMSLPHLCEECRSSHLEEDMMRYQEYWICAACKPRFVVKLQEGSFRKGHLNYAGVVTRVGAMLIDGLIMTSVTLPLALTAQLIDVGGNLAHPTNPGMPIFSTIVGLFNLLFQIFYYFVFVWLMGCSPGQAYFGTRIVRSDGSALNAGQSAAWAACNILMAILFEIPVLAAIWDPEKRTMQDHICNTRFIYKRD